MPVTLAMALLGLGSIAFYICFFVALSRERKFYRQTGGYWSRLRLEGKEDPIVERGEEDGKKSGAA